MKPDSAPRDVYVVSTPGLKGMGVRGALRKRLGRCPVIPMTRFDPGGAEVDEGYDGVAELYGAVFHDFRVREDEWRWISGNLPEAAAVVDIGCGNGALLGALAPLRRTGDGPRCFVTIRCARGTSTAGFCPAAFPGGDSRP